MRGDLVSSSRRRAGIATLSLLGAADAVYMLAYHEGWIDSLVCPFFGEGCNIVGRSPQARLLGVPNAAVGLAGYTGIGTLALALPHLPSSRRKLAAHTLVAASGAAVLASAVLTWVQGAKVRAWCFWCLTSAALNLGLLPLALAEAKASRSGACYTRPGDRPSAAISPPEAARRNTRRRPASLPR